MGGCLHQRRRPDTLLPDGRTLPALQQSPRNLASPALPSRGSQETQGPQAQEKRPVAKCRLWELKPSVQVLSQINFREERDGGESCRVKEAQETFPGSILQTSSVKNYDTRDTWKLEPWLLFNMEELLWLSGVLIFRFCLKCLSFTNDTDVPMVEMIWLRLVSAAPRGVKSGLRWKSCPRSMLPKRSDGHRAFRRLSVFLR